MHRLQRFFEEDSLSSGPKVSLARMCAEICTGVEFLFPTKRDFIRYFQFIDQDFNAETKMQYNRARHFDPTPGQWLSEEVAD